jgi:hypothetical protein
MLWENQLIVSMRVVCIHARNWTLRPTIQNHRLIRYAVLKQFCSYYLYSTSTCNFSFVLPSFLCFFLSIFFCSYFLSFCLSLFVSCARSTCWPVNFIVVLSLIAYRVTVRPVVVDGLCWSVNGLQYGCAVGKCWLSNTTWLLLVVY